MYIFTKRYNIEGLHATAELCLQKNAMMGSTEIQINSINALNVLSGFTIKENVSQS